MTMGSLMISSNYIHWTYGYWKFNSSICKLEFDKEISKLLQQQQKKKTNPCVLHTYILQSFGFTSAPAIKANEQLTVTRWNCASVIIITKTFSSYEW